MSILTTTNRVVRCLLAVWFSLCIAGGADRVCAQTVELKAASDWKPEIRVVIPDVRMCPGEEYDLPVYIEMSEPIEVSDLTLGFRFPDYLVVEPVSGGIVTDLHVDLLGNGSPMSTYHEKKVANLPDRVFAFNWYANSAHGGGRNFVTLTPGQMLFRFRVHYKQEGDGAIDLVAGDKYPDAFDYSHFIVRNVQKGTVIPSFDTAYVRPAAPPVVSALSDTTVCVLSETRLWAEGGVQYYWEDISAVTPAYRPAIAEPRVPNPLFVPKTPGYYTYRVKITSKTGCSAYDTVQYLVLDNGLNLDIPKDTMVDFGGTAVLNASIYGGNPPYTLSWKPVELVETPVMDGLSPDKPRARVNVENRSLPLQKPQWFTLRVEDRYCALTKRQSVNVAGSDIEAVLTMNPSYVCVSDYLNTVINLSVDARGGVGRYNYHWSVENLEPGKQDPVFETTVDGPTAKLRLFSRCVVHVDVTDWTVRKTARFTDTVRFVASSRAAVTIEDLNGSACEMTEMTFTAKPENEGEHPHYSWRIDGSEVFAGPEPVFKTYLLRPNSVVSCVLTSDKACVENTIATATHKPNVVTPGYMAVSPAFGSDAVNGTCGDSLSLTLLHRHTGSRFRLRWFRNDRDVVFDRYITSDHPVENTAETVYSTMPRGGYYDYYRAVATESDRACLLWDSVITDRIYPRLESPAVPAVGSVATRSADDTAGVCAASTLAVYARGVKNLPSQFRLVWYVKKPGAAAVAAGYYARGSRYADNGAYGRDLGKLYDFEFTASGDAYFKTQEWLLKEFPLYLRTGATSSAGYETPAMGGDSIYYTIETAGDCAPSGDMLTSSRFVLKLLPTIGTSTSDIVVLDHPSLSCEGGMIRFTASVYGNAGGEYHWYHNGQDVRAVHPEWLSQEEGTLQDTLYARYHSGDVIGFRFFSTYKCVPGDRWTPMRQTTISWPLATGVRPFLSNDTMVCAGAELDLKATGSRLGNKVLTVQYEVRWAESLEDLNAGRYIGTDSILHVTADSARFGDRSGDLYKDSAVVGVIPYYASVVNNLGCSGVDSTMVTVAYKRHPSVRVVPVPEFPWCDGNTDDVYFKLEGEFWGEQPKFAMLTTRTYSSGDFSDWDVSEDSVWHYDSKRFKTKYPTQGSVLSSMITCTDPDGYSDSVYLNIRERPEAWIAQDEVKVCSGDELTVAGYGCTESEYVRLYGMGYSEDEMMAALGDDYAFVWSDEATGEVVSEERILKTVPDQPVTYRLAVRDKARRCAAATATVKASVALKTGVDIAFTDVATGIDMPFSLCAGSDSAAFYYEVKPQTAVGKNAYAGFVVVDIATGEEKDNWRHDPHEFNPRIPVMFYPGERLVYYCFHDTLSCNGDEGYDMDSVDIVMGRPEAATFMAGPDTMLCETGGAYLYVGGATASAAALPTWAPSLRKVLTAQGVPGTSDLPDKTLVYWWPQTGMPDPADKTSLVPFVSPDDKQHYRVWAYNEYGCIQSDSVRVERFDGEDIDFKLVLAAADSVLCDTETLSITLDRQQSSILTLFDSLVWRRVRPVAGGTAMTEVLAVNTDRIDAPVAHGDTVYVAGFVRGDGLCEVVDAAWYISNKIVAKSYRRPTVSLTQVETAACADSLLELRAHVEDGALLRWTFGAEDGGGIGTETPQYEILDGGRPTPFMAWCQLRTLSDFTAVVAAYYHPTCIGFDSLPVQVRQTVDTLRIHISDVPAICGTDPVEIRVTESVNAGGWRWWLNDRPLMGSDLVDENGNGMSSLGNRIEWVQGRFSDGDLIWVEARTEERCAYLGEAVSDTVRIRRSETPIWHWLKPVDTVDADGIPMAAGCLGEPLALRLLVEKGGGLHAEEWQDGVPAERTFVRMETTPEGQIYGLDMDYPQESWLYIGLGYENCSVEDSIRIVGRPYDTVAIAIEASALSVCAGLEVSYELSELAGADSIVWYVNDRPVLSGYIATEKVGYYTYRPEKGDRVYAEAYRASGACVVNNGLRSNELTVEVLTEDDLALAAALKAEADSVCGPAAVAYTVDGRGFDSVYWYVNGQLSAVTDLLSGVTTAPEMRTASWKRVPRPAAEGADSVCAVAVRRERVCALRDSLRTNIVSVYRREVPVVTIAPRDTTVTPDADLTFSASGASAYVWWTDAEYGIAGTGESFTWTGTSDTVQVSVMGYEPAYDAGGLAGGEVAAPAPDAYEAFGCYAYDSVRVRPGGSVNQSLFIPNAVLVNSARPADRVFKVFGEEIASVHMRIYNGGGDMIFEKTGDNPVWRPGNAAEPGNYAYRLVILLQNGEIIKKNGWISVLE